MGERRSRSVVITGASRGLGLATATHLHRQGWTVLAAMRTPDAGLRRLKENLGPAHEPSRLIDGRLDLEDPDSIESATARILDTIGAPDGLVHNAGLAGAGAVEEMPVPVVEQMFATNLFGPIRLTKALLPGMRAAGRGRVVVVVVSSHAATSGIAAVSAYGASKSALERWAESLSVEIAPFGLGVSVLVSGTFRTDILELTQSWKDATGPYAPLHAALESVGDEMVRFARRPARFAPVVERALQDTKPGSSLHAGCNSSPSESSAFRGPRSADVHPSLRHACADLGGSYRGSLRRSDRDGGMGGVPRGGVICRRH
jgi:NAD(P)-dependent dehydrogenase (short-subunit alcohol dehydrogenase family)